MTDTVECKLIVRGKNIGTILVGRFMIGAAGSLGATLVGGTISDIYPPEEYVHLIGIFTMGMLIFAGEASLWLSLL